MRKEPYNMQERVLDESPNKYKKEVQEKCPNTRKKGRKRKKERERDLDKGVSNRWRKRKEKVQNCR